jgi:hypothetical protein
MSYSQTIFNKDLYQLTYNDIVDFFNTEKDETLYLEFKSYPAAGNHNDKENAVLKAICALLNSEGGIVIWGAPVETRDAQGNTSAIGALTPFTTVLDRDRFINKVTGALTPLPIGIRVQKLNNSNNDSIFVIEVEKSDFKPHQFKDKYYIRLDGQTRIAPHYLIEAMMKGVNFPLIRGHIRLKRVETSGNNILLHLRKIVYNSSPYLNELNLSYKIIAGPGTMLIDGNSFNGFYDDSVGIVSNGRPFMGDFILSIPSTELTRHNNEVQVALNFVGEKSPSKTSVYKYSLVNPTLGEVADENSFIIEKRENKLSSDISDDSDDDKINFLLDS